MTAATTAQLTILALFFRSAFFIFCAEYRPKVKGDIPGATIGDVAKKLGEMWNGTSSEDKVPFEKKAAKLKEKYEKVNRMVDVGPGQCHSAFSVLMARSSKTHTWV